MIGCLENILMKIQRSTGNACRNDDDCNRISFSECTNGECVCIAGATVTDMSGQNCELNAGKFKISFTAKIRSFKIFASFENQTSATCAIHYTTGASG